MISSASEVSARDSASDDSDTSSSSESEDGGKMKQIRGRLLLLRRHLQNEPEYVRFEIEDEYKKKLNLPEDTFSYLIKQFSAFIPDKLLNEKYLKNIRFPPLLP